MGLDRIQIVRNFSSQVVLSQALSGVLTTPFSAASTPNQALLTAMVRVGSLAVILAAGQAVTVTDPAGGAYTITNPAGAVSLVHVIPVINGHKSARLSGSGTVTVVVYAD